MKEKYMTLLYWIAVIQVLKPNANSKHPISININYFSPPPFFKVFINNRLFLKTPSHSAKHLSSSSKRHPARKRAELGRAGWIADSG